MPPSPPLFVFQRAPFLAAPQRLSESERRRRCDMKPDTSVLSVERCPSNQQIVDLSHGASSPVPHVSPDRAR